MTQTELAERVGIARSTLACIENGHRNLTPKLTLAMCDVLKVRPIVLMNDDFFQDEFLSGAPA